MTISRRKLLYSSSLVFGLSGCTTRDENTVYFDTENISDYCDMNCDIIDRIILKSTSDPKYKRLQITFTDVLSSATLDISAYNGFGREVDSLNININEDTLVMSENVFAGNILSGVAYMTDVNISVYDWTKKNKS